MASTDQLFQFDCQLYEQREGVATGSPLGPLLANVFMCHLEEELSDNGLIPSFYKRYVDDTLEIMPGVDAAENFLDVLNGLHQFNSFYWNVDNKEQQQIGDSGLSTNTGLLLHFQSHTDLRYNFFN